MAESKDKNTYAPPATQVDLEERQKRDFQSRKMLVTADAYKPSEEEDFRDFAVEGNDKSAYLGTSPEYQTYANDTEKPMRAEDGPEKVLEDEVYEDKEKQEEQDAPAPPATFGDTPDKTARKAKDKAENKADDKSENKSDDKSENKS